MIVPMKKAVLFVFAGDAERALQRLKALGVLHVDSIKRESAPLAELVAERAALERALGIVGQIKVKTRGDAAEQGDAEEARSLAREAITVHERLEAAGDEARRLDAELARLAVWGDFDPKTISDLRAAGVEVGLYELSGKECKTPPPPGAAAFTLARRGGRRYVALFSFASRAETNWKPVRLPAESTAALRARRDALLREMEELEKKLHAVALKKPLLERALVRRCEDVEFEEVRLTLRAESEIVYLSGFIPAPDVDALKAAAREEGWGVMVRDPEPGDDVPVLVRRPKPLRIIKPLFDFLGTVPGYGEYDISLPFLFFFSIFFAMLIGDAGYGFIFLVFTLLGRVVLRKIPPLLFRLLLLTAFSTIIWGALTGTWFGSAALAEAPLLRSIVVKPIATFSTEDNRPLLMLICFIIGLVHITLAHLISAVRHRKSFKGLAEIGRLSLVWGMFMMVLYLVLRTPFEPASVWLIGGGLVFITLFEQQAPPTGHGVLKAIVAFLKGFGKGLANLFLTVLSAVSTLADIISYVRLFAVGLAGVEIAKTFNKMAADIGGGAGVAGMIVSVFILFIGHALNLVLALMSVLVHGVRLNMLEFSGHLGMEWSGRPYRPFAFRTEAEKGE